MSLIKQSDVKNHLSPRHRTKIHLCPPASQPDATGFSMAEPGGIQEHPADFGKDFVREHSSCAAALAPGNPLIGSVGPQSPAASKSLRS